MSPNTLTRPGIILSAAGSIPQEGKNAIINAVPDILLRELDAIFVLGGGVPSSYNDPPVYVKERCDAAEILFLQRTLLDEAAGAPKERRPAILTLSAGTAHMPQLLSDDGLPVWESTASAAYLMQKKTIPSSYLFAETTSYDTISNAYFARTTFADVFGWNKILVITNEFHMLRTKAIFDWVFGADSNSRSAAKSELFYLSVADKGLSEEAIVARKQNEARGEKNVQDNLSKQYSTLLNILEFLTTSHDFYSAPKLVERARGGRDNAFDPRSVALKMSYGATEGGRSPALTVGYIILAAVAMAVLLSKHVGSRRRKNTRLTY
mmetsp:Transcript_13065/g.28324  ORF Transcript_13065/g.28324 Transcript_13065/m.28324 type:complete len:322 (+) Transcript_13065:399-1364(+)